jgi:hypothetical protein
MRMSERDVAALTGLSRQSIRSYESTPMTGKIECLTKIATALNHRVVVLVVPDVDVDPDLSVVAISNSIIHDGFESWKIHLMNFVDHFRKMKDARLIQLPPAKKLDRKLRALICGTVNTLCEECQLDIPDWSARVDFLPEPWFVSGMESLKATCLIESPYFFRRCNIFVQENFLQRA